MITLRPARASNEILPEYRDTPVAELLAYHNLGKAHVPHARASLLIGMCMDNRIMLRIPDNFAFILRAGGANFQRVEFKVSFAVGVGGVRAICLIGHDQCGMVGLGARRETFVNGLVENGGWTRPEAEQQFDLHAPAFEIDDAAAFVMREARRLRERYPRAMVAPLFYRVVEGLLYQVVEGEPAQ